MFLKISKRNIQSFKNNMLKIRKRMDILWIIICFNLPQMNILIKLKILKVLYLLMKLISLTMHLL